MNKQMQAFENLLQAREEFITAKKNVPDYTGHLNPCDYYQDEEHAYEKAMERFIQIVKETDK
jgi:hypothetical protein